MKVLIFSRDHFTKNELDTFSHEELITLAIEGEMLDESADCLELSEFEKMINEDKFTDFSHLYLYFV